MKKVTMNKHASLSLEKKLRLFSLFTVIFQTPRFKIEWFMIPILVTGT